MVLKALSLLEAGRIEEAEENFSLVGDDYLRKKAFWRKFSLQIKEEPRPKQIVGCSL